MAKLTFCSGKPHMVCSVSVKPICGHIMVFVVMPLPENFHYFTFPLNFVAKVMHTKSVDPYMLNATFIHCGGVVEGNI